MNRTGLLLRIVTIASFLGLAALASAQPASAEAEFCPAEAYAPQVFQYPDNDVLAFRLMAYSQRTVHGDIMVQTDTGWYTAKFPEVALAKDDAKMVLGSTIAFDRVTYVSEPLYVRFPVPISKVLHLWVENAQSKGDKVFEWDKEGMYPCTPPSQLEALVAPEAPSLTTPTRTNAAPPAAKPPAKLATVSVAVARKAPHSGCATPYAPISITAVQPDIPDGLILTAPRIVEVQVAVAPNDDVLDAFAYQPSDVASLDDAAITAAKASTYLAGTALCGRSWGEYLYRVEFGA